MSGIEIGGAILILHPLQTQRQRRATVIGTIQWAASVMAVESLLRYRFKQKNLLEETLTHPSCTESVSYQRLEFVGDAALGLALTNYVFLKYPGKFSLLRSANISTDKLARVAVRHRLYEYVREFVVAVKEEQAIEIYGD